MATPQAASATEIPGIEAAVPPTTWERFSKKFKDEPLVPIGAGLTTFALLGAARSMRKGDSASFNIWLRARVVAQGLTVLAAIGGSFVYAKERALERAQRDSEIAERKRREAERGGREGREREEMLERMRTQESFAAEERSRGVSRGIAEGDEAPGSGFVRDRVRDGGAWEDEKRARKEEQEQKRAWIRRRMAESAKEEGRALRMPTSADFDSPPPSSPDPRRDSGGGRLV